MNSARWTVADGVGRVMTVFRFPILTLVCGLLLPASSALAQNSLLDRWYSALFDVNRIALADLLAEDAVINLEDLGVTQTKAEFVEALDEWEDVVKDANLAWQIEDGTVSDLTTATVLVCYQFPDKELLIREVFEFRDSAIISSVQTTIGDTCENF